MVPLSDLSVIVVTYNSRTVLADCLRSLVALIPGAEILVVDNGSDDGTRELAASWPQVRVISGHGNVGFGAAVNRGAAAATRSLLLILNPDAVLVEADPGGIEALARGAVTGVIGCGFVDAAGRRHHLEFAAWGWRTELRWTLLQFFLVPRELRLRRPRGRAGRRWVSGAACVLARRELLEAGGFDEHLFLYYEDFDLCRRYRERGLPIRTTDVVALTHVGHRSSPRDERRMAAFTLMSLMECVAKWEGPTAAHAAAAHCLRLLRATERIGGALAVVPLLGPRAAKKGREAASVRQAIAEIAERPPAEGAYAAAAEAARGA